MVRSPFRNVLRLEVTESCFQHFFDDVAADVVDDHHCRHGDLEVGGEGNKFQLFIDLWNELGRTGEGDQGDAHQAPIHAPVLSDAFSERPSLIVDGECGYLLDQLQQVHSTVEEGRLKVPFQVDIWLPRLGPLNVVGKIDEGDYMNRKLAEHRPDNVEIEDVRLRSFFG